MEPPTLRPSLKNGWLALVALLAVHAALLAWGALQHSPSFDEIGHLPAGVSHLKYRNFQLYRVNPPLVRMVAALPVVLVGANEDWSDVGDDPRERYEWAAGRAFLDANGPHSFILFTYARWTCISFSLLGGFVCYRWASDLFGFNAGLMALVMWCFSPNIIAHGQMITPDIGATAFGAAAFYCFWRWLRKPNWELALVSGGMLGLAQCSKTTWIILYGIWPLLWLVFFLTNDRARTLTHLFQLGSMFTLSLMLTNMIYLYEGSFTPLGHYRFQSSALIGKPHNSVERTRKREFGNRFASNDWVSRLPVPLPENYVQGIDFQKREFERRSYSYLRGEWRKGGWRHYYLYALAVKVPLGSWLAVLTAAGTMIVVAGCRGSWRDELVLLVPVAAILVLVSSQMAFNRHLRYVLPIFPFIFIWCSRVARSFMDRRRSIAFLTTVAVASSVMSSLWTYPHSLSYFNELAGGPRNGHAHLHDSNIDWGQDLLYLRDWIRDHPEAEPIGLAFFPPAWLIDTQIASIDSFPPPSLPDEVSRSESNYSDATGPLPGWYAISVCQLINRNGQYDYFLELEPHASAGYSIYIYYISPSTAIHLRKQFGLPEVGSVYRAKAD